MTNSPATFQALMNSVFADLIAKGEVAVYMDDILIYSKYLKEHRQVVREVLKRLEHYDLYLKPEKCEFKKDSMEYLGILFVQEKCRWPWQGHCSKRLAYTNNAQGSMSVHRLCQLL